MNLFDYIFSKRECTHNKIPPEVECAYCPDCGELVENQWFILRCACCGVKVPAVIKNGKIVPLQKHCTNCGMSDFNVEKLEKVNFINVDYAVLMKKTVHSENVEFTQSWVDSINPKAHFVKLGLLR